MTDCGLYVGGVHVVILYSLVVCAIVICGVVLWCDLEFWNSGVVFFCCVVDVVGCAVVRELRFDSILTK